MFPLPPPSENGGADCPQANGVEDANAWRAEPSSPTHSSTATTGGAYSTATTGGAWTSPFTTPPPGDRRRSRELHRALVNRPPHITPSSGFLDSPQPASSPVLPHSTTPPRRTTHEGSHVSATSSSRDGKDTDANPTVSQFTPSSTGLFHATTDNQIDSRQAAQLAGGGSMGTLFDLQHAPQQAVSKLSGDPRYTSEPNQAKSPSRLRESSQAPRSGASTPPRRSLLGSVELPGVRRSRHARQSSTGGSSPTGSGKLRSASKLFPGPVVKLGDELVSIELRDSRKRDKDEEIGECKICLSSQEQAKIIAPCKCKGSARFVHYGCLRQWILERRSLRCELCNTEYAQPFYNSFKEEMEANPPRPQFGTQSPFDAEANQQNARPAIVFAPGDPNFQADGIRPDPTYWPHFLPPPDQVPMTGDRASKAAVLLIVGFCVIAFIIIVAVGAGVGGGVGGSQ